MKEKPWTLDRVSGGFGYDPFSLTGHTRAFYERWHANGGESARDCAGIMKRANDLADLRDEKQKRHWHITSWKLARRRSEIRLNNFMPKPKASVSILHSERHSQR